MSSPGLAPEGELVEEPPPERSTIRLWVLLLAGPVLWALHFGVVYFFAEAACVAREEPEVPLAGSGSIVAIVVVATVVLALAAAAAGLAAWRTAQGSDGDLHAMAWGGVLLCGLGVVAILAVGLPALVLEPC